MSSSEKGTTMTVPPQGDVKAPGGKSKLGWNAVFGYGAGDIANNLAFTTTTMFLVIYYTDAIGLAAGAVGTLMLVVRIFDAFADIFAGQLVDRVNTRWGKFRPFILFGGIPLLPLHSWYSTFRTGQAAYSCFTPTSATRP